jgi:hypothetical protein
MDIANCLVALGGNRGNCVPKMVTAPEIPVLRAIHGEDAVFDIAPLGTINVSAAAEIRRLRENYQATNEDRVSIITTVYAGSNPTLPMTLAELELPDEFFAVERRVARAPAPAPRAAAPEAAPAPAAKTRGRKKAAAPAPAPEPEPEADDGDDLPELPADREDVLG